MSGTKLRMLADLLERLVRWEALTDSERRAAIGLAELADRLAEERGRK